MTTKIRPRTLAVLVAFVGLLGVVAVTIPSSGAVEPSVVRLNLGSDGRFFEYGTSTPRQYLTTPQNGCQITSAESLIDLSSTPVVTPASKSSSPGLGPDGIGVKQSPSSGNGTPCTQVESTESLTLKAITAAGKPLANQLFKGVRLDLEMTGNALVQLTFSGPNATVNYYLQTGTSIVREQEEEDDYVTHAPYLASSVGLETVDACAAPNSSGPNSGSNDNCQWTVLPINPFSAITLTTIRGATGALGTVSLEGGGDFPLNSDNDTLFYIANSGPTAVNDGYTTLEDTQLSGDVTDNDTDPDGNTLTGATATSGPTNGDLTLASDGSFTYAPHENFNGTDSFTYTVSDGRVTSNPTETVSITVTPVNDRPVATGNAVSIEEGGTGTVDVADDLDTNDTLTVGCTEPAGWDIVDLGGGEVRITPPAEFVGERTISCTVTDEDGATTESPVTIAVGVTNVNDAPVAFDDEVDYNPDDGSSVDVRVLLNDSDPDGDTLTATNFAYPDGGSATFHDGIVTYTPPLGIAAPVTFTYRAFDGVDLSGVATVTVYPLICRTDTVTASDGGVTGSFTRLNDPRDCKRYTLDVDLTGRDSILFQPAGDADDIEYRGVVSFGVDVAPLPGESPLRLSYDPLGGTDYRAMLWCHSPEFDDPTDVLTTVSGFPLFAAVTGATLPTGHKWCIASAQTWGDANGDLIAYFQVYGVDDPRMSR